MYAAPNLRIAKIREDIRTELGRERGEDLSGPDFYGPFWRSAKDHVFGIADLRDAVRAHIDANPRRANLYALLRDGFLTWWEERRRWTNEPFREANSLKGRYLFPRLNATVKVDSIMAVRDASEENHFIYPYFAPQPVLQQEPARLALWLVDAAIPALSIDELRVLDVIRGQTFSVDRTPLLGDEEQVFERRYAALLGEWDRLRREYDER